MAEKNIETRINITPDICNFLKNVSKNPNIDYSLKMKVRISLSDGKSMPYSVLTEAHEFYSKFLNHQSEKDFIELYNLVKSSKVFIEAVPEPVRPPELKKRLEKLKFQQEEREYNRMVSNVKSKKMNLGREVGAAVRTTSQQMCSIFNFLLSVFAAFGFGYVTSQYAFADNIGLRIIFSLGLSILVAIADLYFMARTEI